MMTFRELVYFWEQLKEQSAADARNLVVPQLLKIMHKATNCSGNINTDLLQIRYNDIGTAFENFEQTLEQLKTHVKTEIAQQEPRMLARSLDWYEETLRLQLSQHPDFLTQLRNQRAYISKETEELFISRAMRHSDWHYAAMIIHPGVEPFMQHMVGHDPLYVVDESEDLLDQLAMKHYNEAYQRRLRPYVIEESFDHDILARLPDAQFGLCFAYNFFNFRPVEMIEKYLREIYQKLSPGGLLIMTFNNCEHVTSLDLVVNNYACYATTEIIEKMAANLNYKVEFFWDRPENPGAWIELRKPGSLSSNRGGQTMAKIVPLIKHPNTVANNQ
jgi:SAM-dependent methyltransferase